MMWKLKSELLSNKGKRRIKKKTRTHKMQLKKTLHRSSVCVCVFTCVRVFVWAVCVDYVMSNQKKKGREVEIS